MKKRILLAVVLTGALTVGTFAQGMQNQQNMMNGQQSMQRGQGMGMQGGGMQGGGMMGSMMGGGMQMFSQLNLTQEQKFQLSILRDEMMLDMRKQMHQGQQTGQINQMGQFIKDNGFDKVAFKKHMDEKHEKMLNLKANNMEKSFKILTKKQIVQLKKNLVK